MSDDICSSFNRSKPFLGSFREVLGDSGRCYRAVSALRPDSLALDGITPPSSTALSCIYLLLPYPMTPVQGPTEALVAETQSTKS